MMNETVVIPRNQVSIFSNAWPLW